MKTLLLFLLLCIVGCSSINVYDSSTDHDKMAYKKVNAPFHNATDIYVSQGAFGKASHSEPGNEYSWDFDVPYGTDVLSVEDGNVIEIWAPEKGGGCDQAYSNFAHNIKIEAADGTVAQYVHIDPKVKVGQHVHKGEVVALTAMNGFICHPQLHFGIYKSKNDLYASPTRKTLPVLFDGIPGGLAKEGLRFVVKRSEIATKSGPEIVRFKSGSLELGGELFLPEGQGPFPTVLYNHGSAPGMLNSEASKTIAPLFTAKGWAFFMPYRRGQGLSSEAGKYIGDEIDDAAKSGGEGAAAEKMVFLLKNQHLSDQLAALSWLREQKFVKKDQIAVAGNSFGGIETVLGAARENYCAAVDASGGAESWAKSSGLQKLLKESARSAKAPIFFFQAENDFDLSPSRILSEEMKSAGKTYEIKIYPAFGKTPRNGHSFAYAGSAIWFDDVFAFLQKSCLK